MKTSSPRVSVVLGVFNDEQGVGATLDSLARQDFDDFEVVVVDDGSTDGTPDVLKSRGRELGVPFRVARHLENQGLTRSLIEGCALARGELIARIDAGDRARPTRLRQQVDFLAARPECELLSSAIQYADPAGELLWIDSYPANRPCALFEDGVGGPHHASVIFRAGTYRAVGGYRSPFRYAQDHDLWYRLLEHGDLFYLESALTEIRIDATGITAGRSDLQRRYSALARDCAERRAHGKTDSDLLASIEELAAPESGRPRRRNRAFGLQYYIGSCLLARRDPRAARYLRAALALRPVSPRAWIKLLLAGVLRVRRG